MGLLDIDVYTIRIFEYIRISYANIRIAISAFVDIPNKNNIKAFILEETQDWLNKRRGGPRGRVVKVADFSALDHSIISPMWVRASLGARVTCGTSQVLLAGVSGGFSPGTPVFAPPTD